jgi:hypothetical protein
LSGAVSVWPLGAATGIVAAAAAAVAAAYTFPGVTRLDVILRPVGTCCYLGAGTISVAA